MKLFTDYFQYNRYKKVISDIIKEHEYDVESCVKIEKIGSHLIPNRGKNFFNQGALFIPSIIAFYAGLDGQLLGWGRDNSHLRPLGIGTVSWKLLVIHKWFPTLQILTTFLVVDGKEYEEEVQEFVCDISLTYILS